MALSKEVASLGDNALATIDSAQTLKASKALIAHIKKASKEKAQESTKRNLLDDEGGEEAAEETPIWLTLTTKRHVVDKARLQPGKISLPHPLNQDESTTICLITADPQRAYKDLIASDEFPQALGKRITRVVGLSKLKAKFSQYEAQRKLLSEHDIFLADDRIINRLPKVLGKTFYKSTLKRPVPVIAENVEAVVESLVGKWVPQRWRNVRGIYIKGPETAALPIWLTDELWLDNKDVISNEEAAAVAVARKEKANIGKKRKSIGQSEEPKEEEEEVEEPQKKKSKKVKKDLPDGDDDKLNKQIADRKAKLKKQKAAAKKALDE
uniref:Ribosomal protein L1 n=1 Tax=Bionectria ochroleuca TaxID=29856 RepID=A0A0B7JM66_BIOOC